jgi:hypothetical protein
MRSPAPEGSRFWRRGPATAYPGDEYAGSRSPGSAHTDSKDGLFISVVSVVNRAAMHVLHKLFDRRLATDECWLRRRGPVLVLTHHPEQLAPDRTVEAVSDLETALARAEELAENRAVSIRCRRCSSGARAWSPRRDHRADRPRRARRRGAAVRRGAGPPARLERTYVGTSGRLTDIRFRVAGPPTD